EGGLGGALDDTVDGGVDGVAAGAAVVAAPQLEDAAPAVDAVLRDDLGAGELLVEPALEALAPPPAVVDEADELRRRGALRVEPAVVLLDDDAVLRQAQVADAVGHLGMHAAGEAHVAARPLQDGEDLVL